MTLTKKNWKTTILDIFGKQESIQGYLLSMNLNDDFVRRYTPKERDRFEKKYSSSNVRYLFNFDMYVPTFQFSRSPLDPSAIIRYLPNLFQIKDARRQKKEILSKSDFFLTTRSF